MLQYAAIALVFLGFYVILLGQGTKLPPARLRGHQLAVTSGVIMVLLGAFVLLFPPAQDAAKVPTAAEIVEEMKKKSPLPRAIDDAARLDGLMGKDNTITYAVTLLDDEKAPAGARADALVRGLRKKACASKEYITFFKLGIGIEIRYADEKGRALGSVAVTPGDCGY